MTTLPASAVRDGLSAHVPLLLDQLRDGKRLAPATRTGAPMTLSANGAVVGDTEHSKALAATFVRPTEQALRLVGVAQALLNMAAALDQEARLMTYLDDHPEAASSLEVEIAAAASLRLSTDRRKVLQLADGPLRKALEAPLVGERGLTRRCVAAVMAEAWGAPLSDDDRRCAIVGRQMLLGKKWSAAYRQLAADLRVKLLADTTGEALSERVGKQLRRLKKERMFVDVTATPKRRTKKPDTP